jgi:hypothetical protein
MFAFNFKPPSDPHKPFVPIVEEKAKPKAPKPVVKAKAKAPEPEPEVKTKAKAKAVKEPEPEPKPEPVKAPEPKPEPEPIPVKPKEAKKARFVKGSDEAMKWAKMMREKRDQAKARAKENVAEVEK